MPNLVYVDLISAKDGSVRLAALRRGIAEHGMEWNGIWNVLKTPIKGYLLCDHAHFN